ncbi:MAG: hypothetical protein JKY37_23005 [Nannocystaceae bacterium]|nr:hypothetical protein [Nannocystaceae bacterium]
MVVERCRAVDFLFVIDNSESMQPHQDNLRSSFDPFIESIYSSLDDVDDYHVGVVTTDAYRDNEPGCKKLGALVTMVDGPGPDSVDCGPFTDGERYMTQNDDLAATFSCAVAVGTAGSRDEAPMRAMSRAVAGGGWEWFSDCNSDFVRDDALLVTVIITDEGDGDVTDASSTDPQDWFDLVATAKGSESNAVVVSLLNGVTPECPVSDSAFDGSHIANFTRRFTHGFVGGICGPDYGSIFAQAVDGIDAACSNYSVNFVD